MHNSLFYSEEIKDLLVRGMRMVQACWINGRKEMTGVHGQGVWLGISQSQECGRTQGVRGGVTAAAATFSMS